MMKWNTKNLIRSGLAIFGALLFSFKPIASAKIIDDFDDNKVKGWEKFDFGSGNGYLKENNGQLTIGMHQAAKQQFFVAATYSAETFSIEDGVTLEFQIDLLKANQPEAYAAVGFIPTETSVSQLSGYSAVKDNGDIILAKGLNKFFYDITEGGWTERPENVTLSISMTGKGKDVALTVKVLDLDNNNEILFEQTSIDTPLEDEFQTGIDSPSGPFIGKPGNFVLLLYHNDTNGSLPASNVTLDNARVSEYKAVTLDNFDDNKVVGWEKFDFGSGNGYLKEKDGKMTIGIHQAPKQQFFVAATYSSETFVIEEGNIVEFSIDLIESNQPDSFAVLSFIPKDYSVSTLTGYSFAKDVNDLLLAKGLNKYFYDITEGDWIAREDNIRLVLSMKGSGESVEVTTKVLDLNDNLNILFEDTTIDTPEVDEFSTGNDSPASSFINKPGNFVLLLYHNDTNGALPPSNVILDNAYVSVTGASGKNQPPMIGNITPKTSSISVSASDKISFTVSDDGDLKIDSLSVHLNGEKITTSNGLTVEGEGEGGQIVVSVEGLQKNQNYNVLLSVVDSEGETDSRELFFDTFAADNFVVEIEDYNFDGGEFIDSPIVIPELDEEGELNWEDDAYQASEGYLDIDYFDENDVINPSAHRYRPYDSVVTTPALDLSREKYIQAGGAEKGVVDFAVAEIQEGEWLNYTRNFPKGDYLVYLRQAQFTIKDAVSTLELVTSPTDEEEQKTEVLGTFLGSESGVEYRNIILTNDSGTEPVVLSLGGKSTLRLQQKTTDEQSFYLKQNYLIFVKYEKPTIQLQASDLVQGPYKTDSGAKIDEVAKTVTLGQAGSSQFYRLSGVSAMITDIRLADGKVVISYE